MFSNSEFADRNGAAENEPPELIGHSDEGAWRTDLSPDDWGLLIASQTREQVTRDLVSRNVLPAIELQLSSSTELLPDRPGSADIPSEQLEDDSAEAAPPNENDEHSRQSVDDAAVREELESVSRRVVATLRNSNGMLEREQLNALRDALNPTLLEARDSEFGLKKLQSIATRVDFAFAVPNGSRGEHHHYEMDVYRNRDGSLAVELLRYFPHGLRYRPNDELPQRIFVLRTEPQYGTFDPREDRRNRFR